MHDAKTHTTDSHTLSEMIDPIEIAMLVSVAPDNITLVSRPLVSLPVDEHGDLWFFVVEDSGMIDDIALHPQVNLTYADPSNHRYISVVGRASVVRDQRKMESLWSSRVEPYFPEGLNEPSLALMKVDVDSAEYWQHAGAFVRGVVNLLGAIAGNQADIETHRQLDVR